MRVLKNKRGDTLVEVVIALAILSAVLAVAYNVANMSYRLGVQSRESIEAAEALQGQAEALRAWRDQQVAANLNNPSQSIFTGMAQDGVVGTNLQDQMAWGSGTFYCNAIHLFNCAFTDHYTLTSNANPLLNKLQVVITVKWDSILGGPQNSQQLTYYLTDTRPIACDNSLAGTCS